MNVAPKINKPKPEKVSRFITPEQIAIDISRPTRFVLSLIRARKIPAIRVSGKTYRVESVEYESWLKSLKI